MELKKTIEYYIAELLFDHDCVIIPGFGGFVGNYASAYITEEHVFFPPFKKLAFNSSLTTNDGLLADFVSRNENLKYADALDSIKLRVKEWTEIKGRGEAITFEGIGSVHLNKEQKPEFIPDQSVNFLPGSYGLSSFQFLPLGIENKKVEAKVVGKKKKENSKSPSKGFKRFIPWMLAPAAAFLLFFIPYKAGLIKDFDLKKITAIFYQEPTRYMERAGVVDFNMLLNDLKEEENEVQILVPVSDSVAISNSEIVTDSVTIENAGNFKEVRIIGGCFIEGKNAKRFLKRLLSKGFKAEIADTNRSGLIRVSYNTYLSREAALKDLVTIRETNPEAWLLGSF